MKKAVTCCSFFLCAFVLTSTEARSQQPVLIPPDVNFRGLSLEQWSVLATQWQIAELLGDPSGLSDTVRGVRFLPAGGLLGEIEVDVTLREGTPFVFSSFFVFGELYDDGSQDSPDDPIIPLFLQTAQIETILDGNVVLQGTASGFTDRLFGPVFFDEPIFYNEPQPRGPDLNAVAALFVFGVGAVYAPLPVGEHTLENTVDSEFFGLIHTTVNITVVPPIQRFRAICTGDQEVPPVETRARSVANLTVLNFLPDPLLITTRIDQRLSSRFLAAHIHLAPVGVNGPIVVPYDPPIVEFFGFAISIDFHTSADFVGPLEGMTMHDLVKQIQAGNAYVNVHTANHPPGEVRGQIE